MSAINLWIQNISRKKLFKKAAAEKFIIVIASVILMYLIISIYFTKHFFFNTVINEVNISLKAYEDGAHILKNHAKNYELLIIERNGETEKVTGQEIGLQYMEKNNIHEIYHKQNSMKWIVSFFQVHKYYVNNLYTFNHNDLDDKINKLNCLNKKITEPENVRFKYRDGSYEVTEEVYGNKIIKAKLKQAVKSSILKGESELDLNETLCYENPKYTINSDKTLKTRDLLNKYAAAVIIYKFGGKNEILDGNIINRWLGVDGNLDVVISKTAVKNYIKVLSRKYDTVGITRNFRTSTGKIVEVEGGLYGWKINQDAEMKALTEDIKLGRVLEKEPVYTQKAFSGEEDEIGGTYVEINITRQHLWFYKDGKLLTHGPVVTGNPNRGHSTVTGTHMINYKQKSATLIGADYEVMVNYWMPFYGNIGVHDARWRHSFGGEIYKRNGTHGCVNAPFYLAKTIFENIEEGTPVICYEE